MFKKIVRRNLVALMIPVIIIELMLFYMSMQLSLLDEYRCYEVNDISTVDILYREGEQNISFDYGGKLYPAGFDHVNEKKTLGSYYYCFRGSSIQLFILNPKTYEELNSGKQVRINARLINDEATISYIKKEYTDITGLGDDVYDGYIDEVIISEVDYPIFKVKIVRIVQIASLVLLILSFVYTLLALVIPTLSFGFSNKGLFGSRKELIETLDNEIENRLDHKDRFLYITEDYVIKAYISRIVISKREE